jgi:hypothetical protein
MTFEDFLKSTGGGCCCGGVGCGQKSLKEGWDYQETQLTVKSRAIELFSMFLQEENLLERYQTWLIEMSMRVCNCFIKTYPFLFIPI